MTRTYIDLTVLHRKDGSMVPLIVHWPDGRQFEVDKLLDVRPAPTVGGSSGKRYVCRIANKQVSLLRDNLDGKWYIEH